MRTIVLIVIVVATLAGCKSSSSNGSSTAPAGVDQSIWDDYCSHGAALLSYIKQSANGTLTSTELATKLQGSENGIDTDAQASKPPISAELQEVADSIGRLKVSLLDGDSPDYTEVTNAVTAVPTCNK